MRLTLSRVATLIFILTAASSAASAQSAVRLDKPVKYSAAGISVALPFGFIVEPLWEDFQILSASELTVGKISRSISLVAIPVKADTSPKSILDTMLEDKKSSLAFRHLKISAQEKLTVSKCSAFRRTVTYSFRGIETAAVSLCFVRDIEVVQTDLNKNAPKEKLRVAYVLTVEAPQKEKLIAERVSKAVSGSMKLFEFERPFNVPIDTKSKHSIFLNEPEKGYGIKLPAGWVGRINPLGVAMMLTDYKAGGILNPALQSVCVKVPQNLTAKQALEKMIEFERKNSDVKIEVVSQRKCKIAGKPGYEMVLKKTLTEKVIDNEKKPGKSASKTGAKAKSDQTKKSANVITVIEIHRLVSVPEKSSDKKRQYAFILTCQDVAPKKASKILDKLLENLLLYKPILNKKYREIKPPAPGELPKMPGHRKPK